MHAVNGCAKHYKEQTSFIRCHSELDAFTVIPVNLTATSNRAVGLFSDESIAPAGMIVDFRMTREVNHDRLCRIIRIDWNDVVAVVLRSIVGG